MVHEASQQLKLCFLLKWWCSHVFFFFFPDFPSVWVTDTNPQTDPRGQKNTQTPPSCGWSNNRKREMASPRQPALRTGYREVAGWGRGACVVVPEAWPNCLPADTDDSKSDCHFLSVSHRARRAVAALIEGFVQHKHDCYWGKLWRLVCYVINKEYNLVR